ncbi:MAG TPA: arsenic transporter [Puia sp.]|nr:arsenic transporter [Puia sp.]
MGHIAVWGISFFAIAGVIIRPFRIPEVVWAVAGAGLLVLLNLLSPSEGWMGVRKGTDVYLFLTGMMLLAETAREERLFDWLAAHATKLAKGSPHRLFWLIYGVGTVVTVFLSNDATAVVLTPAVAAAARTARSPRPLPYLLICAFIANAASFVLPISNPANLVIYDSHMPPLLQWLSQYTLPSVIAIVTTGWILWLTQQKSLRGKIESDIPVPSLSPGGRMALGGIAATAIILLVASAMDLSLGLPTAITGTLTSALVLIKIKKTPWPVIKGVSWSVLPLVAGLFVMVEALDKTGLIQAITSALRVGLHRSVTATAWGCGLLVAASSNLMNNLPVGLIAGNAIQGSPLPSIVKNSVLIGVDLGPNLSITGSLATILWLTALRREGQHVGALSFLRIGALVMTIALLFTLAAITLQ